MLSAGFLASVDSSAAFFVAIDTTASGCSSAVILGVVWRDVRFVADPAARVAGGSALVAATLAVDGNGSASESRTLVSAVWTASRTMPPAAASVWVA